MHCKTFICKGVQGWSNYLHLLANWCTTKPSLARVFKVEKIIYIYWLIDWITKPSFTGVATLALDSQPRQGFARLWAKREARSHTTYSRECEKVWGNELSHPKGIPLWELESQWTPKFSKGDYKGQNSMAWKVLYINGKLLERKYLKWARIAHLDIWNTSYVQKKGQESNWQFDSRPLKVGNRPNFVRADGVRHTIEKLSTRDITLL